MSSVSKMWTSLGNSERVLAVLFAVGFILGFLLTPLGFETRMNELRTFAFAGFFVTVGTKSRRRSGGNRCFALFPHRARRPGTVFLHGPPTACRYGR